MAFEFPQKVLFKHCDPAGIVFFPRYFEMMNDCVEVFFDQVLGLPFEELLETGGVPTAQIETKFVAPSRHGDELVLRLSIEKVGKGSATYQMTAHCEGELRFDTTATLVKVDDQGRPVRWSESIRLKLISLKESTS